MIIIDRVQMNLKTMLVLTGIAVAVFVVAATIAIPLQTSSAQSTNTISVCQQSNTTYCRNQGNQQNQQGDNTQGNSIANQVTSINPHTNAINNVQYSITKSSGITIEKNDTANLTN